MCSNRPPDPSDPRPARLTSHRVLLYILSETKAKMGTRRALASGLQPSGLDPLPHALGLARPGSNRADDTSDHGIQAAFRPRISRASAGLATVSPRMSTIRAAFSTSAALLGASLPFSR